MRKHSAPFSQQTLACGWPLVLAHSPCRSDGLQSLLWQSNRVAAQTAWEGRVGGGRATA